MGASVTVYCLEMLTDYLEFERLCHDIMALEGYGSIEPLGGFNDKGRDAIHVDRSNRTTIFAYSVREDWQVKLWEDARKIQKHGHSCYRLVFSTTAVFSAGERDEAIELTKDEFGWELELYGIERLRVLLDAQYPHLKHSHPHIFPTQLLALQSRSQSLSDQDHLFISYASEDSVLAGWLAQRLTAEGYRVWCEQFDLLGGETYPDDIDEAIRNQTFRVLALYSQASLKRPEIARQRALALSIASERDNDFLIPLQLEEIPPDHLDQVTRRLNFIPFEDNWAKGLGQLLNKLQSIDCPKPVYNGKNIAAGVFLEKDVICEEPEMLLSNCLEVVDIPKAIHRFRPERGFTRKDSKVSQFAWAHRRVNSSTVLSFNEPPSRIDEKYRFSFAGGASCADTKRIEGIWVPNLVSELIRKSLLVKCHDKGLLYCKDSHLHYFPYGLVGRNRLRYTKPDGTKTYVNAVGERKYSESERYRYYLAPVFWVNQNLVDGYAITIQVRIRFTDARGNPLHGSQVQSRRKHLCRNWWNRQWLGRFLAICQYLADGDRINIGRREHERIEIKATPLRLRVAMGVDEDKLASLKDQDVKPSVTQSHESLGKTGNRDNSEAYRD